MSRYVDVYVLPVPKANVAAYKAIAETAAEVWRDHGALDYIEIVADDVKDGVHTSFPQAVKLEADEVVVVGWITFKSREDRDRINDEVMKDPRMKCDPSAMPFDGRRMFWGGFQPLVGG